MKRLPVLHYGPRMLIYALAVVMLAGCNRQAAETPPSLRPVQVLSARARLEEAWQLARQWREDAELIQIQASVIGPEQVAPLYVNFTFESPREDHLKFYAFCSSSGCSGREFKVSRTSRWQGIEFEEDMIDSMEAARIGLQNGGERYAYIKRETTMLVRLGTDNPRDVGPVVWLAYFATGYEEPLYVVIDPYTGEVIRTE